MDQELKKLVKKNLELNKEMYDMVKYIKRFIIFQQIFGAIKILLIVVPLVLGIIYLPPLIKDTLKQYQSLIGVGGVESSLDPQENSLKLDKDKIPPELLKELQQYK